MSGLYDEDGIDGPFNRRMASPFRAGDRVVTPGGLGTVAYVRMAPPAYADPACYSVRLDARPGSAGTVYPAEQVSAGAP